MRATAPESLTSAGTANAVPPWVEMAATVASASSRRETKLTTTAYPAAASTSAMLRPIPREAPVTSATLLMVVEYSRLAPRRRRVMATELGCGRATAERLGEACGSGDSQVGSMGIRAIPSQAMGAPAFSAAWAGGNAVSQSAAMKRRAVTLAAASDTSQRRGGTMISG